MLEPQEGLAQKETIEPINSYVRRQQIGINGVVVYPGMRADLSNPLEILSQGNDKPVTVVGIDPFYEEISEKVLREDIAINSKRLEDYSLSRNGSTISVNVQTSDGNMQVDLFPSPATDGIKEFVPNREVDGLLMIGAQRNKGDAFEKNTFFAQAVSEVRTGGIVVADHHMPIVLDPALIGIKPLLIESESTNPVLSYGIAGYKETDKDAQQIEELCDIDDKLVMLLELPEKEQRWINKDLDRTYSGKGWKSRLFPAQIMTEFPEEVENGEIQKIVDSFQRYFMDDSKDVDELVSIGRRLAQIPFDINTLKTRIQELGQLKDDNTRPDIDFQFLRLFMNEELYVAFKQRYPDYAASFDRLHERAAINRQLKEILTKIDNLIKPPDSRVANRSLQSLKGISIGDVTDEVLEGLSDEGKKLINLNKEANDIKNQFDESLSSANSFSLIGQRRDLRARYLNRLLQAYSSDTI